MDPVRRRPPRRGHPTSLLIAAAGCALLLVLSGCSGSAGRTGAVSTHRGGSPAGLTGGPASGRSGFALLQMNLCLSGLAGCFRRVAYPDVLDEATTRILQTRPDTVTLNEACRGDVAEIARRAGYRMRFSRVYYNDAPLPCIDPGGRGLFGDAVLTRAPIAGSESQDFAAQYGNETRRWLCVTTSAGLDVCTTHLSTRENSAAAAANAAQCAELVDQLGRRAATATVAFGGDLNRPGPCVPVGMWTRTDSAAHQARGDQHVSGTSATLSAPRAVVIPARHTDHDLLLVRARVVARGQ